mgnify:CR=1 FL=1
MNKVLIVIPAYNEEANIENVVRELEDKYPQFDYIVVNDGSRDRTAAICRENGFNLLDLPVNLGLAGCFQAGMKYAYHKGYEYAIQFDGDGQHRPEFIEPMMEKMKEGYEIVIGSRFVNAKKDWSMRMLGSRLIEMAIRHADVRSGDDQRICPELKLRTGAGYRVLPVKAGSKGGRDSGAHRGAGRWRELFKADGGCAVYGSDASVDSADPEFPEQFSHTP